MQPDVSEETVFRNDDIEVIFLHAQHLHLHYHVTLQSLRGFPQQVKEYFTILHDPFRISGVSEPSRDLTFHNLVVEELAVFDSPVDASHFLWIFEDIKQDEVLVTEFAELSIGSKLAETQCQDFVCRVFTHFFHDVGIPFFWDSGHVQQIDVLNYIRNVLHYLKAGFLCCLFSFSTFSNSILWKLVSILRKGQQFLATISELKAAATLVRLSISVLSYFNLSRRTKAFLDPSPEMNSSCGCKC